MRIVKAKLIKRTTDDGLFEIEDDIPIGKQYLVDLDSMEKCFGRNTVKGVNWEKVIIYDVFGGWMPTELLEFMEAN